MGQDFWFASPLGQYFLGFVLVVELSFLVKINIDNTFAVPKCFLSEENFFAAFYVTHDFFPHPATFHTLLRLSPKLLGFIFLLPCNHLCQLSWIIWESPGDRMNLPVSCTVHQISQIKVNLDIFSIKDEKSIKFYLNIENYWVFFSKMVVFL